MQFAELGYTPQTHGADDSEMEEARSSRQSVRLIAAFQL